MVAPASETGVSDTREAAAAASLFLHCPRHINFTRNEPVQYAKGLSQHGATTWASEVGPTQHVARSNSRTSGF